MIEQLRTLPEIPVLRDRCRAMAMLDAIFSPEWQYRYFSFNSAWGEGEEMASMRDGQGNDWFLVFSKVGAYGRAFDHEAPNAPHLVDAVPSVFADYVAEPAFAGPDGSLLVTVCFWRQPGDTEWGVAAAESGAENPFAVLLEGTPQAYRAWAEDYYETELDPAAVDHIYALRPLTQAVVSSLNPTLDLAELDNDLAEINYPR
ncbi:hypothetical protein JMUB6875_49850 [Nocardia sp. JMUB6875]|uniref:hypothetical protein n=1 Tax=Nocardia sp. JMUB6875 TaxID=3158170 RepID=UPI0032E6DD0F